MFLSDHTMKLLLESGLPSDKLVQIIQSLRADEEAAAPVKSKGAVRQDRYRHNKASRGDEKRNAVTVGDDVLRSVTETVTPETSLARVRDKPPRLVISGNLTTPDSASAGENDLGWPETDRPGRPYLDQLMGALSEAAGPALASPAVAPKIADLSPILALGRAGKGPPCDLQADVLPAVRARCARAAPGSVKGWGYFRDAILEARDRRLSGAPAVADVVPLRATGPPRSSWDRAEDMRREGARRLLDKLAAEE